MQDFDIKDELEIFKEILNTLPNSIYIKDTQGRYIWLNKTSIEQLKYKHLISNSIIGKSDFEIFPLLPAEQYAKNDKMVLEKRDGICIEEEVLLPNEKKLTQLSFKEPLYHSNQLIGILGYTIDITDRKKAEQKLKIAKEMAESANQAKTEFLSNMRHDLRTPFSGILGLAGMIAEQETNPEKKEDLSYIVESAQALLNHINEILEYIQLESGQLPILEKPFDVYKLLKDTLTVLLPSAKSKQLDLTFTKSEDLPQFLLGDAVRTQRILINLISNAIKFTDKGSIKVAVQTEDKVDQKVVLNFTIEDTGIGIPEDKSDIIFERFNRLTSSYSGTYAGKGLGLKIVRQFLEEISGQAYLTSEIGKGSVFKILIPYQLPLLRQLPQKDPSKQPMTSLLSKISSTMVINEDLILKNEKDKKSKKSSSKQDASKSNKILLVEDHPIAAKIAKSILSQLSCEVDIAENGRDALEQIEKNSYDLIFMDVGLPDMDGCTITKQIRLHRFPSIAQIPIVALTAHAESEDKKHCLDVGMNMVITKPLTKKWADSVLKTFIPKREKQKQQFKKAAQAAVNTLLPEKIVDIEYAKALMGGNEIVIQEILTMLVDSLPEELTALETAYQKKSWDELRDLAHKLKGGSSYCGTLRLKSVCTELESYIKSGLTAKIPELYQQLLTEIDALQKFMLVQKSIR